MQATDLVFFALLFATVAHCNKYQPLHLYNSEAKDDDVVLRKGFQTDNGSPWPMPQSYRTSEKFRVVDAYDFEFLTGEFTCNILDQAFSRYYKIIFGKRSKALKYFNIKIQKLNALNVILQNPCQDLPSLDSSESYSLTIDDFTSTLKSASVWGILRGLETFSQIVHNIDGRLAVNYTWIDDFPRFPWRGVLLDTSRHFLPLQTILHSLDAMSYNKMNVFHWHIVDDHSFPYDSYKFPNLGLKGAYRPYTHMYTQNEIKKVIEYATLRGIRVVVEFDSPGHMKSWEHGQPGLLTECYTPNGKPSGSYGPIDPSKNSTFDFIQEIFDEISKVFPDSYIHLGGDEVDFNCWKSNPQINEFMKEIQIEGNYAKLESYYIERLITIVNKLKKNYLVWQEVFDNKDKVDNTTVIHVWKGEHAPELERVTKAGLKTILSSPWYLDYVGYGALWKNYYKVDPHDFTGTQQQKDLVMGGEACLWGEYVDSTNVHSRLWPSASAVAERLWSPQNVKDVNIATPRLEEHRCRMLKRGILAGPPSGPGFCDTELVL